MPRHDEPLAIVASLHDAGLNLLPIKADSKAPDLGDWKQYQTRRYPKDDLLRQLDPVAASPRVAIVCGAVSGGVEAIDFDLQAMLYPAWRELVEHRSPGLLDRLVIETSPSGGRHVLYRCESPVPGSEKLADVRERAAGPETVEWRGKPRTPTRDGDAYFFEACGIETRGEGGIIVCWPTRGYAPLQGDLRSLPTITQGEREVLISSAEALTQRHTEVVGRRDPGPRPLPGEVRPGDDFNERGDVAGVLRDHGWRLIRDGENQYWARPGGSTEVHATLRNRVFFVFSTNAQPFEANEAYSPFAVYTLLNHQGDFKVAARMLTDSGSGHSGNSQADAARGDAIPAPPETGKQAALPRPTPATELIRRHPSLRDPIIEGVLRQGEVMNIIAAPKSGKSWMVLDLAAAVATGSPWLGRYATTMGRVLLLDYELHDETLADRLKKVLTARGLLGSIDDRLDTVTARGAGVVIGDLDRIVRSGEQYSLVIVDAFYRALGTQYDENDNSAIADVYNLIDKIASINHAAIVLVHHTTKGEQGHKSVTDVGSGAGAQSRAADAHLVLRDHREDGVRVLDATVRSWPRFKPVCLRFDFPLHWIDDDLDPSELRRGSGSRVRRKPESKPPDTPAAPAIVIADQQIDLLVDTLRQARKPLKGTVLEVKLEPHGISGRKFIKRLDAAVADGKIVVSREGKANLYSVPDEQAVADASESALPATPTAADAGESVGVSA